MDRARQDARHIVSNGNGFAIPIVITKDSLAYNLKGTSKRHTAQYDDEGNLVNSRAVTCTVSELDLIQAGINLRVNGEVQKAEANKLRIQFTDATGQLNTYKTKEVLPDEHLGLIVFILSDA
ncbi:hypothetical protein [uncultured Dysgonomonas sp.]|uniref:hypothetical protein n=1 Tax=uncultured Dysgonomonas sp. TaxID=206096 RepID=UPI00261E803A|nr:hypothetical protein [uncultured Dysgonomonas sp.]